MPSCKSSTLLACPGRPFPSTNTISEFRSVPMILASVSRVERRGVCLPVSMRLMEPFAMPAASASCVWFRPARTRALLKAGMSNS
jgi:hypothetical protein